MNPGGALRDQAQVSWADRLTRQQRLRAAILIDAIKCLRHGASRPLHRRVRRWIVERDDRSPFSFEEVCEALHLSPARVRRSMLAIGEMGGPQSPDTLETIERLIEVYEERSCVTMAFGRLRSGLRRLAAGRRRGHEHRTIEHGGRESRP
jgi:hypothetical protein